MGRKEGKFMANIGKRIKARREESGMTQAELAKRLGDKSKTTIKKITIDQSGLMADVKRDNNVYELK